MTTNLNNDNKRFLALIGIVCLLVLGAFVLKRCNKPEPSGPVAIPEIKIRDSFRTVIKYHDSTRINVLNKWRNLTRITDSTPCYTEIVPFIQACDTVIKADSVLIGDLKKVIELDSIILVKTINNKNDTIKLLTKEVKKQKWQKRGILALWILREGLGVAKNLKQ